MIKTIAAAQLTSYQLAMQQQYAQQLAAAPGGMLFPGSYIVPAQANPAGWFQSILFFTDLHSRFLF